MGILKERHDLSDYLYWSSFGLIPLLLACFAIAQYSMKWVVIYIIVFAGHFLILEYRFFCTHCPHYCNDSPTTNCMFLWGVPKFFKRRPHPLSKIDIFMLVLGFSITIFFPLYWLLKSWQLCIIYFLSWIVLFMTMKRYECPRCIYLHCPANSVEESIKKEFTNRSI
jgi:hypothetical protein